ncbi:MAG: phosphoribosyltransferase [Steroidobacteraceae bacterium]
MTFRDRMAAGRVLAALLDEYANRDDTIVLGLPRGGVPVAREIALALRAPLDVLVVRKLGIPWQPEFAAGAIAPGGVLVLNHEAEAEIPGLNRLLEPVVAQERRELARREASYRRGRQALDVAGRTVILVDDGIATGATIEAAAVALRAMHARSIVIAVPVAPPGAIRRLARHADRIVCPEQPADFMAVGQYYDDFPQLTDAEVVRLLVPGIPAVD